jgi:hypothetical protein
MSRILLALVIALAPVAAEATLPEGWFDVMDYGAIPDDAGQDGPAIQAAIDACHLFSSRDGVVVFPVGSYHLNATLNWKNCSLYSADPGFVYLIWDGPAAVAVTKSPDNASFAHITGFDFRRGAGTPSVWIDSPGGADIFLTIDRNHFGPATLAQVRIPRGWANLHMKSNRFDNSAGYAIDLTASGTQYLSSFSLDDFTYDNHPNTGSAGVVRVTIPSSVSNAGIVRISNARIEANPSLVGDKGYVSVVCQTTCNPNAITIHLEDLAVQDVAGMVGDSLVHLRIGDGSGVTTGRIRVVIDTVLPAGVDRLVGGNWPATIPLPPGPAQPVVHFAIDAQGASPEIQYVTQQMRLWSVNQPVLSTRSGTANVTDRYRLEATGAMQWGDGTAVPDVRLERQAPSVLGVAAGDVLRTVPTDTPPACNAATRGGFYYDASVGSLCVCNGGAWRKVHDPASGC